MKKLLIFMAVLISGGAGYKIGFSISKKKYENLADDEINAVKKAITDHYEKLLLEKPLQKNDLVLKKNESGDIPKGLKQLEAQKIDYSKAYRTDNAPDRVVGEPGEEIKAIKKEEVDTTKPYIITPEEFKESEYECKTLFYCADKVLTDDDYNQITNIGIVGGHSILEQMGKYDADCLYVRDKKNGYDYEILLEQRTFRKIRPLGVVDED